MASWAPQPSTVAAFLLGLDERGADGVVPLGARTITLRRGRVVGVSRGEGDRSVAEFLRATGRIDEATLSRVAPLGESSALTEALALPAETVHDAIRTVWLDRLVRALGAHVGSPSLEPSTSEPVAGATEISLGLLVLDALERLGSKEAEEIGARASGLLEWVEAPFAQRAQRWLGVEGKRARRVSGVLSSRPGAAARLAALARAGLVRVVDPNAATEKVEPAIVAAPVPPAPSPAQLAAEMRESLPPMKPPALELSPGAGVVLRPSIPPSFDLPRFPPATAKLDDPLDPLERKLAAAEERNAPPAERAKAWRQLGDAWLRLHGAIEETARCYREAAAADKQDVDLLQRTAEVCVGAGQLDVALAYGRAAVAVAKTPDERGSVLLWYALFCRRFDMPSDALGASRAAQSVGAALPEAYALAAELEENHRLDQDAMRDLLEAGSLCHEVHPDRAHGWIAKAWLLAPNESRAAESFASSLASRGQIEAALAVRANAARALTDLDQRRRILLSLAERAELAERPLIAAQYQLEVLETEPLLEVVHDSVAEDLEAAGLTVERALVLEDLAFRGGQDSHAELSLRAAEARVAAGLWPEWTLVLARRALEGGASLARSRDVLEALRTAMGLEVLVDLIEDVAHGMPGGTERRQLFDLVLAWGGGIPKGSRRLAMAMRERKVAEPSALSSEVAAEEAALEAAQERLRGATGSTKRATALEVAHLLATTREGRSRAMSLAEGVLDEVPSDDAEDLALRIALARGDGPAILRCAARMGARSGSPEKRQRALHLALAAACEAGDAKAAGDAAIRLGRLEPQGLEVSVRLRRLGLRSGEVELAVQGLRGEASLAKLPDIARARSYARLASLALDNGAIAQAARAADEALALSPTEGLAALVGLRAIARGEAPTTLLPRVQAVLGELPALLAAGARAHGDAAQSLSATVTWASLEPTSPEPTLAALEESLARGIDDYLEPGVHAILTDTRAVSRAVATVGRALTRIAERGEVARAAELTRRAAMYFGPAGQALRPMALDLGRRDGDSANERAALELLLPPRENVEARVAHLEKIAELARRAGDRAAEARTLLRVLAHAPRAAGTIERLSHLFAETGENDRLFATLELLAEGGEPSERAKGLLSLAAASSQVLGDDTKTGEYLDRLAALSPEGSTEAQTLARADALVALGRTHDAVELLASEARAGAADRDRRGSSGKLFERAAELALKHLADPERALAIAAEGLRSGGVWTGRTLLLFEQLALERKQTDLAESVYRDLVGHAMGERGRRALTYRRARWLERRGDKRAALDALVEACAKAGSSGAVANALERVAREVGDLDALARGYTALAEAARHPILRGGLVERAVRIWEEETGHPERAFEALVAEWKKTFSSELEPALARLANAVSETDAAAGDAAYRQLFTEIERHAADAWMGEEKARLLMKAGRLHAARGALDEAVSRAEQAIEALVGDDADATRIADTWLDLSRWQEQRGQHGAARDAIVSALAADPSHAAARALAERKGIGVAPLPAKGEAEDDFSSLSDGPEAAGVAAAEAAAAAEAEAAAAAEAEAAAAAAAAAEAAAAEAAAAEAAEAAEAAAGAETVAAAETAAAEAAAPAEIADARTASEATREEPSGSAALDAIASDLEVDPLELPLRASTPPDEVPSAPRSPVAVPDAIGDDDDLPARVSRISLWAPASTPPGAPRPASLPPLAPVRNSIVPPGESAKDYTARLLETNESQIATSVLRGLLMETPSRFELLVQLEAASREAPDLAAIHHVASGLLSLTSMGAVPPPTALDDRSVELAERLTQPGALAACFAILERLFEALPFYRQSLAQHGVVGTDRIAVHGTAPISRALSAALSLRASHADTPVFLSSRTGILPQVLRTTPSAVLMPLDWSRSEPELRFAIARCLELAQPRAALLATLSDVESATLFDAVRAAFGPADGGRVDKHAAQLASELWRSLPVRTQRDVRELVAQAGASWDRDAVRTALLATASRVGLLACGDIRVAIVALLRARKHSDVGLGSPEAFSAQVEGDPELADLIRVALSDDFIHALR